MSASKHTPGPWRIARYNHEDEEARLEMDCNHPDGWRWSGWIGVRTEANARLIAAAPDMLGALKEMLEALWGEGDGGEPPAFIQRATDAIARAEGRDADV
jgi:hypothetical protein